ncbi:ABC transporter membrane-spanning permease-macrolide efflux [Streptococcus infantarius subsp. infantarius]|uniref:MFS transporter n=1 Tax=Streptococcus suis TaxID=1307 RepID=A0A9X4RNP4_STRSU|nr:ABC transporter membrane-spanning permease-macrolide efflux [Streptococcus infantarius subsp. infantarius]MDG4511600.1 MFS transporter [Streptococcus suis]MCO4493252.1 ABC transporter membrane-spanning permease-macrolide efflux [Streptococcus infantarius subsp. infantarius]MCO4506892.1 ABC transporter membrane-spanning permease-macrolide efflux [Streptococcus infantarius subsp. infantarius]MCO4524413.1 ABC transporter membrane-spanning permease-macrolide efflux [Streptococcus infantarius sub
METIEKKNSAYLIGSRAISRIGDIMFDFANNTFLAGVSPNSLSLVAIYQSLENIISVVFNLFGGVIADRFRRKKILISTNFFSGLLCISLSFIGSQKWMIYAVVVTNMILALFSAFSAPAYKAFTKEIVNTKNITKLNSYLELSSTIIKLTIPLVAVFLYKWIGVQGVLLLDGVTFILSSLLLLLVIPIDAKLESKEDISFKLIFKDLFSGIKYLLKNKKILLIIILSSIVNFFLAAYNLLLPYSSEMFPNLSDSLYAIFLVFEAVGGLIGASLSGYWNKELSIKKLLLFLGLSGITLAFAPVIYLIFHNPFILATVPGAFSYFLSIFNIQFFSLVQREVDNQYIGRIFGIIFTIAILFMPIGSGVFSILLKTTEILNFFIVGISILFVSIFFGKLFRKVN